MVSATLIITVLSISIGSSFQFGYQTGVVNEVLDIIGNYSRGVAEHRGWTMEDGSVQLLKSVVVAAFAVGGMLGGVCAGWLAAKLGRKGCLLANNIPMLLGSCCMLLCGWLQSYELLVVGRFLVGIASGVDSGVAPMYLSEIAPASVRGASGTINQFAIVVAILVSQLLGLDFVLGTGDKWHYLLAATLVTAAFQVVTLPWCPESPRHLLLVAGQHRAAREALGRLRSDTEDAIEEELAEMHREAESEPSSSSSSSSQTVVGLKQLVVTPHLRHLLLIACGMQITQQLSGINAVINYSSELFRRDAGMSNSAATYATIGIGVVNVLVTLASVFLVDRAGRKTLHLTGLGGMCLSAGLLTVSLVLHRGWQPAVYPAIGFVYLYVVFFATGPGSIPWFIVAELFGQSARSTALSCAVLVNWSCQIIIGLGYLPVQNALGVYSFLPFVVLLLLFFLFTWFFVPETKGRSSEEIEQLARERTGTVQYEILASDPE